MLSFYKDLKKAAASVCFRQEVRGGEVAKNILVSISFTRC